MDDSFYMGSDMVVTVNVIFSLLTLFCESCRWRTLPICLTGVELSCCFPGSLRCVIWQMLDVDFVVSVSLFMSKSGSLPWGSLSIFASSCFRCFLLFE